MTDINKELIDFTPFSESELKELLQVSEIDFTPLSESELKELLQVSEIDFTPLSESDFLPFSESDIKEFYESLEEMKKEYEKNKCCPGDYFRSW